MKNGTRHNKIYLSILVILTVAIMGVAVWYAVSLRNTVFQQLKESVREQVSTQNMVLKEEIESGYLVLRGMSSGLLLNDIDNSSIIIHKLKSLAKSSEFVSVYYIYPDGEGFDNEGKKVNVEGYEYYEKGINNESVIQLVVGKEQSDLTISLAVPVYIEGEVRGIMVGNYTTDVYTDMFEANLLDVSDMVFVCNSQGVFITATDEAYDIINPNDKAGVNLVNFLNSENVSGRIRGDIEFTYEGEKYQLFYEPLGLNDWYAFTLLPYSDVNKETFKRAISGYIMVLGVLLFAVALFVVIFKRERHHKKDTERAAKDYQYKAEHDALTQIYNFEKFTQVVSERLKGFKPGEHCIVYADIYKFKMINDIFGRDKGDEILCKVADSIQDLTEKYGGIACRINSDRFAMYMPYTKEVLDELEDFADAEQERAKYSVELFLYLGVYIISNPDVPVHTMIDCANIAQKTIKGNYGKAISEYDENNRQMLLQEQEIVGDMVDSLENGEFVFFLQPQYNAISREIIGAEALVRWNSPSKGFISPGQFIPIFEANGFITKMDEYIWEQVCKKIREWIDRGITPVPISINVSRVDIMKTDVPYTLKQLIDKYNLEPEMLKVEITESAYMSNANQLMSDLDRLKNYGFTVEMDDFGSGYSSLNMLKDLPIDVVKTDLKFLDSVGIDNRGGKIMESVIKMIHNMKLHIIAEGVETKEQVDHLTSMECTRMQGFFFEKPVPVERFEEIAYGIKPEGVSV